jgi:hypothetical protein
LLDERALLLPGNEIIWFAYSPKTPPEANTVALAVNVKIGVFGISAISIAYVHGYCHEGGK